MDRFGRILRLTGAAPALLALVVLAGGALAQGRGPAFVKVDQVKSEPLAQTVPVVGRVVSRQSGRIAARSAGPVAKMLVEVGDRVKAGQLLVRLVTATLEAQRDLRLAELTRAREEFERLERLRRSAAFPRARFEQAVQDMARAKASLRLAQIALNYAEIRAPYPGVVTVKHTEIGAFVRAGEPVVSMVNDKNLEIEADVPVNRTSGLSPGRKVFFMLAGKRYPAAVRAVVPVDNPLTRTRAVRFLPQFATAQPTIAVNESVTVAVPIGARRMVVTVHKDAIVHFQGRTMVFAAVKKKGAYVAAPVPVKLGDAVGSRFIVLAGLKPGMMVVVRGNERLRPMQPIRFRNGS